MSNECKLPKYIFKDKHIDQDTLDYYINRSCGITTEVKVIGSINRNGIATVKIIKSGLLIAKEGEVIKNFSLWYGILQFIKRDYEVLMWDDERGWV